MKSRDRLGGLGALLAATTFVIGLTMYATLLLDYTTADTPGEAVEFLVDNQVPLRVWNLVVTVVFALAMVPLALALHDRLGERDRTWSRIATVFGLLWAGLLLATGMITNVGLTAVIDLYANDPDRATTVWAGLDAVQRGLGGGNELVGGAWVLIVSAVSWRVDEFSRGVNALGMTLGACGLVTVVPTLEALGAVFGLGLIVWYVIIGVRLVRPNHVHWTDRVAADGATAPGLPASTHR